MFSREELRGISRGKDAKDVDWEKVAGTIEDIEEEEEDVKPLPIKISVAEVLNKARKPNKRINSKNRAALDDKNSKFFIFNLCYTSGLYHKIFELKLWSQQDTLDFCTISSDGSSAGSWNDFGPRPCLYCAMPCGFLSYDWLNMYWDKKEAVIKIK